MNYWDEHVIVPVKRHAGKEKELNPFEQRSIERILEECHDAYTQEYILEELDSIYRDYCLGKKTDYWLQDIMSRLMQFDQVAEKVIPQFDLLELAESWAKHSESVRVK